MVEGPKVLIKSERLRTLVGKILVNFLSNVPIANIQTLFGANVVEVLCVGKELFIVFDSAYFLRFHFGMSGTERIVTSDSSVDITPYIIIEDNSLSPNLQNVMDNHIAFKSYKKASFYLFFDNCHIAFYDTTITLKTLSYLEKCRLQLQLDVLSPQFAIERVLDKLTNENSNRIIMDSVMDQNILPGVGNIIKCEGLFLSNIHPNQPTSSISRDKLMSLVINLQYFAKEWYLCTKNSKRKLIKHVYSQHICQTCQSTITLIRDGKFQRITYFCNICQPYTRSQSQLEPTVVNNLYSSQSSSLNVYIDFNNQENIPALTVTNTMPDDTTTAVANNNNASNSSQIVTHTTNNNQDLFYFFNQPYCQCSDKKLSQLQRVRKPGPTNNRLFWSCSQNKYKKCNFFHWADLNFPRCKCTTGTTASTVAGNGGSSYQTNQSVTAVSHTTGTQTVTQNTKLAATTPAVTLRPNDTKLSNEITVLRRVLKPGSNNGRYFFSCNGNKSCHFFVWADIYNNAVKNQKLATNDSRLNIRNTHTDSDENSSFNSNKRIKLDTFTIPL